MQCLTKPRQQRYFQPDQLRVPKMLSTDKQGRQKTCIHLKWVIQKHICTKVHFSSSTAVQAKYLSINKAPRGFKIGH